MSSSEKWYDGDSSDYSIFISSRVRLARNFEAYPFSTVLDQRYANEIMEKTIKAAKSSNDKFRHFNTPSQGQK